MLTGLDDEHLGTAAVAGGRAGLPGQGQGRRRRCSIRAIRYAVERRRAEASLLRLREEQLAAAESARLERGLLPSPLLAGSAVRARSFYRSGRTRSVLGGDFFDAVLGPSGTVHAIVGDVCGHGPDEAALGALLRVSWRALVLAGVDEPQVLPKLQQVLVSERHDRSAVHDGCTVAHHADADGRAGATRSSGSPGTRRRWRCGRGPHRSPRRVGLPLGIALDASGPPPGSSSTPAGRCCSTRTGSSRAAAPVPTSCCGRGPARGAGARSATPTSTGCPPGSSSAREQINGGPLVDDVAILLLSRTPRRRTPRGRWPWVR